MFLGCFCPYVRQPHSNKFIGSTNQSAITTTRKNMSFSPLDTNLKFFHEFLNFHQSKENLGHFERLSYISAILSNRQHWICRAVARNTISKQTHETYRHFDIKKSRLYLLKMAFGCKTLWTLWKLRKSWKNLRLVPSGEKLTFFLVVVMADWFVDPINLLQWHP